MLIMLRKLKESECFKIFLALVKGIQKDVQTTDSSMIFQSRQKGHLLSMTSHPYLPLSPATNKRNNTRPIQTQSSPRYKRS